MKLKLLFVWTVLILSMPLLVFSQTRQITGRITDQKGDAVPLASVTIKGTNTGTAADENGRFSINVPGANSILVISSVGFQSQEIKIGNKNNLSVELAGNTTLTEVTINTALGIKRSKRSLGYSAQEISGDALLQTKQTNIVNALRGQVAGVQINSGGGAPGQGTRIIIRGIKSLDPSKDNQPLFVIDGIIMDNSTTTVSSAGSLRGLSNRAADINPDDVESISVLRGGAATALYGQAGSNGVVVITTKTAKAGKMKIEFTTTYGIDEVNKFPEVQNKFSQGFVGAISRVPEYDPTTIFSGWGPTVQEVKAIDPTQNDFLYNHYGRGYKQGNQFRASLNLSGGTENALFNSSFSYFKQNGTIPNSDYKNISARVGGQFKFGNKFKISSSINFINSGGLRVNADRFNEQLTYWSPRLDVRDYIKPDGTMKGYRDNPIFGTSVNKFRDDVNRLIGNVALTFSPVKWFDLDYKVGMDYAADFRRHAGVGPTGIVGALYYSDNGTGFIDEYRISNRVLTSNLIGTFKKEWGNKFNTVLRLGNDVRATKYNRLTSGGTDLDIPTLLSINNAKTRSSSQYLEDYRIVSAFGDLTLSYKNFLFFNVTGRNDWSSTLDPEFNSFFYPSASLSYVFTDNLKVPKWFSYGKLRASYAEIGKDASPYENNSYYSSSVITSTSQIAWTRGDARGDRLLKPERTSTVEFGTELRFLQNRLGVDFTWYKLNSRDQIIPVYLSPTTGFTSVITNAGEIENKGIELVLNGTPIRTNNFSWDATLNFSRNRNKVVKIIEGLTEIVVGSQFGYINSGVTIKYVPGSPVGNLYGTTFQRYYGTKVDDKVTFQSGLPLVIASTGSNAGFPVPDLTQRLLGNSQPKWMGGFSNTFRYKNVSLSFLLETQQGQYKYNQLGNFMTAFGIAKFTEDRTTSKVFNGVLADGTPNTQLVYLGMGKVAGDPRDYGNGYYRNIYRTVSEPYVEDASWTRLRNLSLSYKIPTRFLRTNLIKNASVTFTGNNLILWTKYSGFDPETSSSSAGSNADGFTGFSYPAMRSYLFSINVNF
ncbi:MAG: SusC/RagA family TonB-linked outer membrane protein [Bacteroidota bacterium]|nr:SusC/RagA family TonB-linked outer membrane protein [Bacteroidota bacterium]